MTMSPDEIMQFQEFLLASLYNSHDVKTLQQQLENCPSNIILKNWSKTFSPTMLEVAARITQYWGKKTANVSE